MRISFFSALLSIILIAALTYLICHITVLDEMLLFMGIGSAISFLSTLGFAMAVKIENKRIAVNVNILSIVSFIVMLVVNICFAYCATSPEIYLILTAILLVIHLFVTKHILSATDI